MDIFAVTSVINTGDIKWSYGPDRSVFTPQQRFEQTLDTIKSIRKYAPDSIILLIEGSVISEEYAQKYTELCDYVHLIGDQPATYNCCIQSSFKGLGDAYLMYKATEYIRDHNLQFRTFFKLSGRYLLTDEFKLSNFSDTVPTFKSLFNMPSFLSTIMYSVPYAYFQELNQHLGATLNILQDKECCLEQTFPRMFSDYHLTLTLGVQGIVATNSEWNFKG